jgi:hypothetical protein
MAERRNEFLGKTVVHPNSFCAKAVIYPGQINAAYKFENHLIIRKNTKQDLHANLNLR